MIDQFASIPCTMNDWRAIAVEFMNRTVTSPVRRLETRCRFCRHRRDPDERGARLSQRSLDSQRQKTDESGMHEVTEERGVEDAAIDKNVLNILAFPKFGIPHRTTYGMDSLVPGRFVKICKYQKKTLEISFRGLSFHLRFRRDQFGGFAYLQDFSRSVPLLDSPESSCLMRSWILNILDSGTGLGNLFGAPFGLTIGTVPLSVTSRVLCFDADSRRIDHVILRELLIDVFGDSLIGSSITLRATGRIRRRPMGDPD
jgi:hypothetical protein